MAPELLEVELREARLCPSSILESISFGIPAYSSCGGNAVDISANGVAPFTSKRSESLVLPFDCFRGLRNPKMIREIPKNTPATIPAIAPPETAILELSYTPARDVIWAAGDCTIGARTVGEFVFCNDIPECGLQFRVGHTVFR